MNTYTVRYCIFALAYYLHMSTWTQACFTNISHYYYHYYIIPIAHGFTHQCTYIYTRSMHYSQLHMHAGTLICFLYYNDYIISIVCVRACVRVCVCVCVVCVMVCFCVGEGI